MNKQAMMERLIWYQELKKVFNEVCENNHALKSKVLTYLNDNFAVLPLRNQQEYEKSTINQGFSFDDVYSHVESMPRAFSWDQLLDALLYLGIYNKGKSVGKTLNLIQAKNDPKSEENKNNGPETIKEDFPIVKYYDLNEIKLGKNLKFLSLGGNYISNSNFDFPSSLIALNLSYNIISDFQPLKPLVNLKFLNLSHNLIENLPDISSIITLNELFIFDNKLKSANFLFSIKNLSVLDMGNNFLENIEDLAMLAVCPHLQTLNLIGNPLYFKANYASALVHLFPHLIHVDPEQISIYSQYQNIGFSGDFRKNLNYMIEKQETLSSSKVDLSATMGSLENQQSTFNSNDFSNDANKNSEISPTMPKSRTMTPKKIVNPEYKHSRSRSNTEENSLIQNLNKTCKVTTHKRSNSTVREKKNAVVKPSSKTFGNPMAAIMIGPPVVASIFKTPQKKCKNISIDLSRFKSK